MNRRGFVGGMSAVAAAAFLCYVQPNEEKVADLEVKVDDLDARVSALETVVANNSSDEESAQ